MPSEIDIYNQDCTEAMKEFPDKAFDLAIVDPPYGLKKNNLNYGTLISTSGTKRACTKKWDKWNRLVPTDDYWKELFRISENQIIWGINYLGKNFGSGRIVWDKFNTATFSDAEIAFQSFTDGVYMFRYTWNGMIQEHQSNKEIRIHPTQKPVALYKWLLKKYANPNDKVLDTHLGSGSIAIACYDLGLDLKGYEIDKEYYDAAVKRIENHKRQFTFI